MISQNRICFDILIVTQPVTKHISLEYYRKLMNSNCNILVSNSKSKIIEFLQSEQIHYQIIEQDSIDTWGTNGIFYITDNRKDNNISQILSLAKERGVDIDINFLGPQEELSLLPLKMVMEKLRGPGGCEFDKKQTHQTLKPYLIEEAYEVIEAIHEQNPDSVCEELGDLLLQVIFHAQVAEEQGEFQLDEVLTKLKDKLITRHPHVFGGKYAQTGTDPLSWEEIKLEEQQNNRKSPNQNEIDDREGNKHPRESKSVLDKVPQAAPALVKAEKIQKIGKKMGFDWENSSGAYEKVNEEFTELQDAYQQENWEKLEEEIGDIIFSLVNLARFFNISTEVSLERTNEKFRRRFRYIEDKVRKQNEKFSNYSLEELDNYWDEAKKRGI
ncbi:nucleoside triphosphate pyrophosphohydrolase [Natranaerobius thermophilus]|uniref:MazG family protein n=1 Tax=Natranaerobius thermophilus (strain ATCC BAA-1301 / DSM 18059 / JW/NM-WN-LF) TaxID=457570 RepID=B2A3P2_NATTJ|nr:nucleoside triphosphate pyrophosphohydrolase [Natranaerobius thermophilus]ACB83668.1 MazG family protein [Natranaerobius thermophilus JW/NM-WN-LF]